MIMTRPSKSNCSGPRRVTGVGLIEVLIAVVILAFGMLGVAALQAASLRNGESALERSQATAQTYAILDAMRANLAVAQIGGYNIPQTCAAPTGGTTLVANDLHNWITSLKTYLGDNPTTCGEIECVSRDCTITVHWNDSHGTYVRGDAAAKAAAEDYSVVTRTRL